MSNDGRGPRYHSTGQLAISGPRDEGMTPEKLQELRARNQVNPDREAIALRRQAEFEGPGATGHDEALARHEALNADIYAKYPRAAHLAAERRQQMINEAMEKGQRIDWNSTYRALGDEVRSFAGEKTNMVEAERAADLNQLRHMRGLPPE